MLKFSLDFAGNPAYSLCTMSEDQFARLYAYIQREFTQINKKLDQKADKERLEAVYNLLDTYIKKPEIDEQERLLMSRQLSRHEGWIQQLAKNTKTKLAPES